MSIKSIEYKIAHAHMHAVRLEDVVKEYLASDSIGLIEQPGSVTDSTHHQVGAKRPVPARVGLICGDCLQNLRSTLDYLVFELVSANGGTPNTKHMFPIATTADQWQREIDNNNRLKGIDPVAKVLIESLQPFLRDSPKRTELYMIDELTNLNKHRRPILAQVTGTKKDISYNFPHVMGLIRASETPDGPVVDNVVRMWVAFGEEVAMNMEVVTTIERLSLYIRDQLLPLFYRFIK